MQVLKESARGKRSSEWSGSEVEGSVGTKKETVTKNCLLQARSSRDRSLRLTHAHNPPLATTATVVMNETNAVADQRDRCSRTRVPELEVCLASQRFVI